MATAIQSAIKKAAGLTVKTARERERLLRLAHEKKSRGPTGSVKNISKEPDVLQPEQD